MIVLGSSLALVMCVPPVAAHVSDECVEALQGLIDAQVTRQFEETFPEEFRRERDAICRAAAEIGSQLNVCPPSPGSIPANVVFLRERIVELACTSDVEP